MDIIRSLLGPPKAGGGGPSSAEADASNPALVPTAAYSGIEEAGQTVASNVDVSDQAAIDAYFDSGASVDLMTDDFHHSDYGPTDQSIREYYADGVEAGLYISNPLMLRSVSDRARFAIGGVGSGGPGRAAVIDVDFRGSPFVPPAYISDQFAVEPVIRAGFLPALRPGHLSTGIESHPDRYATMRVMSIDKRIIYATTNFFMEGYSKASKESFQIVESTMGNSLHFNNEKYKLIKINLGVLDAKFPFDWLRAWEENWSTKLRGSVLAKNNHRWYLLYSGRMIGGYPIQYSVSGTAKDEPYSALSLDVFVTDDIPLPEMKMITSESGLNYSSWDGVSYSINDIELESRIKENYAPPAIASSPEQTEYTAES